MALRGARHVQRAARRGSAARRGRCGWTRSSSRPDAAPPCRRRARRPPRCPRAWATPRGTPPPARSARACAGCSSRLKLRAASGPAVVTTFQPARPPLTWSSEANRRARLYGSLYVVDAVAISPIRSVAAGERGQQHGRLQRAGRPPADVPDQHRASRRRRSSRACRARRSRGQLLVVRDVERARTGRSPAAATTLRGGRRAHQERVQVQQLGLSSVMSVDSRSPGRREAASSGTRRSANPGSAESRRASSAIELLGDDPPGVEHDHPVGQHDRLVDVVRDQQYGGLMARRTASAAARASSAGSARPARRTARRRAATPAPAPATAPARPAAARRRTARSARPARGRRARPRRALAGPRSRGPGPRSPRTTLSSTRCPRQQPGVLEDHRHLLRHGDLARCPPRRGRARPAPAAACSCRSRCARAARRTRPARCPGPGRPGRRRSS